MFSPETTLLFRVFLPYQALESHSQDSIALAFPRMKILQYMSLVAPSVVGFISQHSCHHKQFFAFLLQVEILIISIRWLNPF